MISVIVPCYNCEKTFARCIGSLREQTYEQFEIILVDDGSGDGTYELCERISAEDRRIKVIHQVNQGLMNAWKRGVREATGDYIAFCDSDDYIERDLIETLEGKIKEYSADIILYGMQVEYANDVKVCVDNLLSEGFYSKQDIWEQILPVYFSNGDMQSGIMMGSRCTKLFNRKLLLNNLKLLDDRIAVGEDDLAVFAAALSAQSVFCMKGYFPYHYVRNNESMIGKYDPTLFDKFMALKEQLNRIAEKYDYPYQEQLDAAFLSNILLCMKKEICRNKSADYIKIKRNLKIMRNDAEVCRVIADCSVRQYNFKSKVFAFLTIHKWYLALYVLTRVMDRLGYGRE